MSGFYLEPEDAGLGKRLAGDVMRGFNPGDLKVTDRDDKFG